MIRAVIDADNMKELEKFDAKDTETVKQKYINKGKWADVSVDIDGDIILWED